MMTITEGEEGEYQQAAKEQISGPHNRRFDTWTTHRGRGLFYFGKKLREM
jgi:hypothetical protein